MIVVQTSGLRLTCDGRLEACTTKRSMHTDEVMNQ